MAGREYLFLLIEGHNKPIGYADNVLVWTSDGRWNYTKMAKDVLGIVNQLGAESWEMVESSHYNPSNSASGYAAVFKRPIP